MSTKTDDVPLSQLKTLYDDIELAILFDWLELVRPRALAGIDIECESANSEHPIGAIRLIDDMYHQFGQWALSNAVARLVLSEIQQRLPQWGCAEADGQVALARTYRAPRKAKVEVLPRFLFMINWADSGPGFSWPESYYVAYLPGFDRYVVTASQDSPDAHGYTDEAIGHFPTHEAIEDGVHRVIVDWWQYQANKWDQRRWAYLFDSGVIDGETAGSWTAEVWNPETDEPWSVTA